MKTYKDIKIGDQVVIYDEYSHDYTEHCMTVTSLECDAEYITETNPKGIHYYGNDNDYDEEEPDFYLTHIHEGNFVRFASDNDRLEI